MIGAADEKSAPAGGIQPPKLPIATVWTVDLNEPASASPVSDGARIYLPLRSGQLTARSVSDKREIWRSPKSLVFPAAENGGLVFLVTSDAIEALRGSDGRSAWILPRVKAAAPLLVSGDRIIIVTDAEVMAVRAADGEVIWQHPAGGVHLQPAADASRVYTGADDGRVLALEVSSGSDEPARSRSLLSRYTAPSSLSTQVSPLRLRISRLSASASRRAFAAPDRSPARRRVAPRLSSAVV